MSTATIIVAIVSLLGVLVSYAFVQQTVQSRREKRARLLAALKARSRSFQYMLNGFPPGFLTKELTHLVHKSLAEVSEQLSKLEPENPEHLHTLQEMSTLMADANRSSEDAKGSALDNPAQIKEVRACLEELHKFVFRLEEKRSIQRNQAQVYRTQIRQMVLRLSIDSYWLHGNQARQAGKLKLAIHYFDLAKNLITKENQQGAFRNKLEQLEEGLRMLRERLAEDGGSPSDAAAASDDESVQNEWDKFSENQRQDWRKKNVYD